MIGPHAVRVELHFERNLRESLAVKASSLKATFRSSRSNSFRVFASFGSFNLFVSVWKRHNSAVESSHMREIYHNFVC
jgi:hypothetical protein